MFKYLKCLKLSHNAVMVIHLVFQLHHNYSLSNPKYLRETGGCIHVDDLFFYTKFNWWYSSVCVGQVHDAICYSFLSGSATCSVYVCARTGVKCTIEMLFWVVAGILLTDQGWVFRLSVSLYSVETYTFCLTLQWLKLWEKKHYFALFLLQWLLSFGKCIFPLSPISTNQ